MVILIGGASCTGKTTLAQKLLERYQIPYLSIDHVKMGLIRGNRYCDFKATDPEDEVTEKLWPIIKGIVKTNIENDQHIIIEGCYIPTDQVRDFEPNYMEHIISFYIGFSENYINSHFINGIIEHRSETEYKDIDDFMSQEYFLRANKLQKERCEKDHEKFFCIEKNYEDDMPKVIDWLDPLVNIKRQLKYNN